MTRFAFHDSCPMSARRLVVTLATLVMLPGMGLTISPRQIARCQESAQPKDVAVSVSPSGVQRHASGHWSSLSVVGANMTDQDAEESVSAFIGEAPELQFSTKFWIPPKSKRQSWLPILLPPTEQINGDRVTLSMIRLAESDGEETYDENLNQMPILNRSLMLLDREINTGLIVDPVKLLYTQEELSGNEALASVVDAARDSAATAPSDYPVIQFNSNFLPPTYGALDQLDQLVIAGDLLLSDSAGLSTVRSWLRRGGRAWIMLDRTSPELIEQLFSDDTPFTVVDQVERNDLVIEYIDPVTGRIDKNAAWTSEIPVPMLRVLTDLDDVPCHIEGWPAAFWLPYGEGEVLFTTLAGAGWLKKDGTASMALNRLSRRLFEPKVEPNRFVEALLPVVDDQIGYQIPSRNVAAFILLANALVILLAGGWWARTRRLERLAILIPASAIATTLAMLWIGSQNAQSVPSTVAAGQVVQVRSETGEADISTVQATYSQQAGDLQLVSTRNVLSMPINEDASPQMRRVSWDDNGQIRWSGGEQPPGVVRHLASDATFTTPLPISVHGTFDEQGFRGALKGLDIAQCQDPLIVASPAPMTAAVMDLESDTWQLNAAPENRLAPGEYMPGTLLSDRQRTRQAFLKSVFESDQPHSLGRGPALLIWSDPVDMGEQFAERFDRKGTALVSIPIRIDLPKPEIDFRVPSTFIEMDSFQGEEGRSLIFNPQTGAWLSELTKATETALLFRFPEALSSMTLQRVNVSMKVNAPSRTLFVKALSDGEPVTVFERQNATGLIEFQIDRKDALQMHSAGGLWLSIGVSESAEAIEMKEAAERNDSAEDSLRPTIEETTTWQIDYVHLDAIGRIEQASPAPSTAQ